MPVPAGIRRLPDGLDGVELEGGIRGQDGHGSRLGLGDEDSIKRVAMVVGQHCRSECIGLHDWNVCDFQFINPSGHRENRAASESDFAAAYLVEQLPLRRLTDQPVCFRIFRSWRPYSDKRSGRYMAHSRTWASRKTVISRRSL